MTLVSRGNVAKDMIFLIRIPFLPLQSDAPLSSSLYEANYIRKWEHEKYDLNITRTEIIITTSFLLFLMRITITVVIYNFKLCGIFEKMTSFTQILNQGLEQKEY